jgi:glycosyltransferase involved in cell wall biosynthesis
MRILHVHSGNLYGGVETMLMTLARRRREYPKLHQQFALCFEGRLSSELESAGSPAYLLGPVRASKPLAVFRARQELRNLLLHRPYEALLFHSAWSYAIFGSVARAQQVPAVVWMHGTTAGKHWTERWARRTDPDLVICNSRFTAEAASTVYPYAWKRILYCPVELNPTALSPEERRAVRTELNTPENAVVIIQVSRMESWKGQLLHLEALSKLKSIPNWIAWFVGGAQRKEEEEFFSEIQREARRLGFADRVRLPGERSDVPLLLKAADIYCQPNLQPEPFGITLIEALNSGLPVVATKMGGAIEIVDSTCGMLVRPGSAEEVAERLGQLIEDPDLRRRFGRAGPARAMRLCDPVARIDDLFRMLDETCVCGVRI